tara:strand:+ start:1631 stop:1876 length:246 start_codon:yes stop_codon:yes gene_type:complete
MLELTKKELLSELNEVYELSSKLEEKIGDLRNITCSEVSEDIVRDIEDECDNSQFAVAVSEQYYDFTEMIESYINRIMVKE